ncbi:MATE family multidrug resistance protein [Stella humosa]|uniref:Multidrug-efflux transporter n=1 Tax=Stella humosa TaxID=94 RepID=A0A3N1MF72_9PROT|nr:MATE family efflux transporter [Stella humosa]ROQ01380.1 MATE family multidrug resistance protein [Stella humosa]BBK31755.1 MATE family efflux transporter [Stella humosa]
MTANRDSIVPHSQRPGISATAVEVRALLALAAPLTLTNLAQIAIMTTDVVMIGTLGPHALAASALGSALMFTLWMFGVGVVTAVAPFVAQARGRGRDIQGESRRTFQQGLWAATIVALPCVGLLMLAGPLLLAMGQEPTLVADTEIYLQSLMWCLPPSLWFITMRTFLSAIERTRPAVLVTIAAIFFNAFGNWVLIHGELGFPALGLLGAGLASTLACLFMAVALGVVFLVEPGLRRYRVWAGFGRRDWARLRDLLAVGVPIGAMMTLECALFSGATLAMGLIGAEAVAAHQIALQCASVTFMIPLGIGQAATVRVGVAAGRGDAGGVARAGWTALVLGAGIMATAALGFLLLAGPIIGLFLDSAQPDAAVTVAYAIGFLFFAAIFQLADGAQVIAAGALRGLKDTRVPMLIAGAGYWGVGGVLGLVLAFPLGWGGNGIWLGLTLGLAVVAILLVLRFAERTRRSRRLSGNDLAGLGAQPVVVEVP